MWDQITTLRSRARIQLRDLFRRFADWWLREFLAFFPQPIARWLVGLHGTTLLLTQDDVFVEMHLRAGSGDIIDSARLARALYTPVSIDAFLDRHKLARQDIAIGIGLSVDQFFERKLVLPIQAVGSLDDIVARDLVQKTPFKLADVYSDYAVAKDLDKLIVTQHLTKRESVTAAASSLMLDIAGIGFAAAIAQTGVLIGKMVIRLQKDSRNRNRWARRSALALATSAALLALIAGASKYQHQAAALDHLRSQVATATQEARKVRETFTALEHKQASIGRILTQKRDGPTVLDIWDEATRLLPTDSWLTELTIKEDSPASGYRILINGFSTAAAKLVLTFDQSPLFHDAALTTGVATDPLEQRERFSLQAQVRAGSADSATQ